MTDNQSGLVGDGLVVELNQRRVLDRVSVVISPGVVTAVVGPNGAGKSTLLSCLAGLRRPTEGSARLDGRYLQSLRPRERAQRLAYLPQTPEIGWDVDVRTFVGLGRTPHVGAFGLGSEDQAAVEEAMAMAAVEGFAERSIGSLSGGERARALIARALAGQTDWLLADEPLTGLDLGHALDALELFRSLAADGKGVLLTLHDLSLAHRVADRIIVLANGRVIADGSPAETLTPEILAEAYGVEARFVEGAGGALLDLIRRAD